MPTGAFVILMGLQQPTVDDVTTTNTLEVWRDKLAREDRRAHPIPPLARKLSASPRTPLLGKYNAPRVAILSQGEARVALPLGSLVRPAVATDDGRAAVATASHTARASTARPRATARRANIEREALGFGARAR